MKLFWAEDMAIDGVVVGIYGVKKESEASGLSVTFGA